MFKKIFINITLFFSYYLIITPIAIISKIFGIQYLKIKWSSSDDTFWNYKNTKIGKNEFNK